MNGQGSLIIISAPSGTGKTSLAKALMQRMPKLQKSISHTTRSPRVGEQNGVDYHFVDQAQFDQMLSCDVFLEHAHVFGNNYGTSRDWVNQNLENGVDVILEIDWQGARTIRQRMPGVVSIFVLPPSRSVLAQRLHDRNQDKHEVIAARMAQARNEISHYNEYDYLIVNDDFERALIEIITIISAARLRLSRQEEIRRQLIVELSQES